MAQKSITSFFKPVQAAKRASSPVSSPAKKAKLGQPAENVEISEALEKQVLKTPILTSSFGPSWFKAFQKEFEKEYFRKLSAFLVGERQKVTVFPPLEQVFTWTELCHIRDVKVVILGQDPYHGPRQAHGLAFSVPKGVNPPPSLVNIFKELAVDIPGFRSPGHGDLTGWAKQGVLLLNACLTVEAHRANSHANRGWEEFTTATIKWLNENCHGIVFMLWGSYAQKKGSFIDKKRHTILNSVHPSPLSAHRGFLGCKHFSKANDALKKLGKPVIDWQNLP
jgi:uracil-DNA glycosylase